MTPQEQAHVFLAMMLCGMGLGLAYDLIGPLRRIRGLCALTDLLYGILCAAGLTAAALFLRCEPFRLYVFAAAACGVTLYGVTLGYAWRRSLRSIQKIRRKCKNERSAAGI